MSGKPMGHEEARFWARVWRPKEGCWLWTGAKGPKGYGRIRRFDQIMLTHRYAWIIANGPIPLGRMVLHHCDNPPCVRPDHLFLGTGADNYADMRSKGRRPDKLTEADVRTIRAMVTEGWEHRFIAGAFGVSRSAVTTIATRQNWAWLQ